MLSNYNMQKKEGVKIVVKRSHIVCRPFRLKCVAYFAAHTPHADLHLAAACCGALSMQERVNGERERERTAMTDRPITNQSMQIIKFFSNLLSLQLCVRVSVAVRVCACTHSRARNLTMVKSFAFNAPCSCSCSLPLSFSPHLLLPLPHMRNCL